MFYFFLFMEPGGSHDVTVCILKHKNIKFLMSFNNDKYINTIGS